MSKLSQLGRNTPLWRRVQRHAQMSAIFAPSMATAVSPPPAFAPTQPATYGELESWDVVETAVPPSQPAPISPASLPTRPAAALAQPTLQRAESSATAVLTSQPGSGKAEDEANWHRLQTIMQRHRQKQATEQASEETAGTVQRERETASETAPFVPPPSDNAEAAANTLQDESTTPAVQSVPLEAVWPVQKRSSETLPSATTQPQPTSQPKVVQRTSLPEEEATQINQNLAQVSPGRQTQSPIETIMPSRPRPQPKAPGPVQRQPVEKNVEAKNEPTEAGKKTATAVPPTRTPKLIQTEIGPLPADLWETLGEQPPEALAADEPTAEATTAEPKVRDISTSGLPAATLQADVARQEHNLSELPLAELTAPSAEQQDATTTAVPTSQPNITNPSSDIIMAKPVYHSTHTASLTSKAQSTAVAPAESTQNLPAKSSDAAIQFSIQQPEVPRATIQRQVAATAIPNQRTAPLASQSISEKVNLNQAFTTKAVPGGETENLAHEAKFSLARPKPTAVEPIPAQVTNIQAELDLAAPIQRETAVTAKSKSQPLSAQSETVIQRSSDLPAAMATATETIPSNLADMMPEEASALNDIPSEKEEAAPTTEANLDIDALARQVYQQLKRKLAVEWERGYGR